MSKTYYCHKEFSSGITCTHRSEDGRCLAATGWLSRLTVDCNLCRDYPYNPKPINDPLYKNVSWDDPLGIKRVNYNDPNRLPQCPLNERRCQFNIDDNECGRVPVCKPIKVKVKKSKR